MTDDGRWGWMEDGRGKKEDGVEWKMEER